MTRRRARYSAHTLITILLAGGQSAGFLLHARVFEARRVRRRAPPTMPQLD